MKELDKNRGALLSGSESEDIDPDDGVSSVSYNHVHLIITNNAITMTFTTNNAFIYAKETL